VKVQNDMRDLDARFCGHDEEVLKQQLQRKPGSWHWHIIAERRPQ